jgi:microcystin-dependent protein
MPIAKITELPAGTAMGDCLLPLVCDPAGEPVTAKVTVDELLAVPHAPTAHDHDSRYYTEAEVDALIAAIPGGDPSAAWPIGSVFISVVDTSPATLLGFGTWAAIGAGRVLVGQDTGDSDFNVLEETGGAKTVTLTEAQIPAHTHTQNSHNHLQDAHSHVITSQTATTGGATSYEHGTLDTSSAEAEATETTAPATATNQAATAVNQNTGGGQAHPNVQPYFVVKMWKRTA